MHQLVNFQSNKDKMYIKCAITLLAFIAVANSADLDVAHYLAKSQENLDQQSVVCSKPTDGDSIYKYTIPHLNTSQGIIDFGKFKGKPLMLVNVATYCQSASEYPVYNQLIEKFGNDIQIVGFPRYSNIFL